MGVRSPYPLPISYGHTDAVKNSGGYLDNWEAEAAPKDARSPVTLFGSPGTKFFGMAGTTPVLNMIEVNEAAYCVTKDSIYRIFADGGTYRLGAFVLDPQAAIDTNGLAIVATDGKRAWSYTIQPDEQQRYSNQVPFHDFAVELTGMANFYPANTVTFLDGYLIFDRAGTNQVFNSGVFALTFDPLAFFSAETNSDFVVAVKEVQQQLWVFGTASFEVWYDTAVPPSPWQRVPSAVGDQGTVSPYSIAKLNQVVFWLSQRGQVMQASSYVPTPISTPAIEEEIAKRDITLASAFCYSDRGHNYYQLTVPGIDGESDDFTAVYDMSTNLWHQRSHRLYIRHEANCYCFAYNRHMVGSFITGNLYDMSRDYLDNDGDPLIATIVTGPDETGGQSTSYPQVELIMDVGFPNAQSTAPVIGMEISDDDGMTWGNQRMRPIGPVLVQQPDIPSGFSDGFSDGFGNGGGFALVPTKGQYFSRVRWQRNGNSVYRRFRWKLSDPVKRSMSSRAFIERSN